VAIPFDPGRGETTGSPITVSERIAISANAGASFGLSEGGTLAYVPGRNAVPRRTLVAVDRDGRTTLLSDARAAYAQPRFSPDGRWLAMTIESESGADVWVHDLQRGTRTRLTNGDSAGFPVWSPDAAEVGFHAAHLGPWSLYVRVADGSRAAEPLLTGSRPEPAAAWSPDPAEKLLPGFVPRLTGAHHQYPMSWTPDGRTLVFAERKPNGERDIWVVERGSDPTPFLLTPSDEWSPAFSPDGHWLAYVSGESGRSEVYVQPYPGPGGRWLISTEGGTDPVWAPNGRELYYLQDDQLMAVPIQGATALNAGTPRRLFQGRYELSDIGRNYDLSPDGTRFVMIRSDDREAEPRIHVVLNWVDALNARRP
jgi:Tol biopolymer transport system component